MEDRRAWERELIEVYLDALGAAGGPKDLGRINLERMTNALVDVESLESV